MIRCTYLNNPQQERERNNMKYTAKQIKAWDTDLERSGEWSPARPESYYSSPFSVQRFKLFVARVKNALGVVSGKYDVLDWEDNII